MKYVCFGYLDAANWEKKSESDQLSMIDACFGYDEDVLKKKGHWVYGEGLQANATKLRYQNGKVSVTDGPYAETKELLGGLLILEAKNLDEAIQLISNHPGMKMGTWEIRPAEDMTEIIQQSSARRKK